MRLSIFASWGDGLLPVVKQAGLNCGAILKLTSSRGLNPYSVTSITLLLFSALGWSVGLSCYHAILHNQYDCYRNPHNPPCMECGCWLACRPVKYLALCYRLLLWNHLRAQSFLVAILELTKYKVLEPASFQRTWTWTFWTRQSRCAVHCGMDCFAAF